MPRRDDRREAQPPLSLPQRIDRALGMVAAIERREEALPTVEEPRTFLVCGRALAAKDLDRSKYELVPPQVRGHLRPGGERVREVTAEVAADVLAVAKFDLGAQVKLRAHYVQAGLTVSAQPAGAEGRDGVLNAVRAHAVVSRHAPGLCPRLLGHGELGEGVRYLVEEWVDGVPVTTSQGVAAAALAIVEGMAKVHQGYGVSAERASARWGATLADRWGRTRATGIVSPAAAERVAALIAADRHLRTSWTHGDLVASNVLRTGDGGVVLIDWEHSQEAPIMQDVAKLHLFSAAPEQTLDLALDVLAAPVGPSEYTAAEELALAHAHFISRYPSRRAALEGHARAEVYERQVRRQVERLVQLLDRIG